jgi:hypothetical protein
LVARKVAKWVPAEKDVPTSVIVVVMIVAVTVEVVAIVVVAVEVTTVAVKVAVADVANPIGTFADTQIG